MLQTTTHTCVACGERFKSIRIVRHGEKKQIQPPRYGPCCQRQNSPWGKKGPKSERSGSKPSPG